MASNVGTVNVTLALGRCKDCRHWAQIAHPMRGCLRVEDLRDQEKPDLFAVEQASNRDGAGYSPCVVTGPEFGCIHYEGKA